MSAVPNPSPSQQRAIEAAPGPLLVLAGPGAGKTYCLAARIHHLITRHGFDPARILAFTFTNKAAGEIKQRLESRLGAAAAHAITTGTIHAFCAQLLREHGAHVALRAGFGIADEEYQLSALRRIQGPRPWHKHVLSRFSAYRFRDEVLQHDDLVLMHEYERFLAQRNILDFDHLVIRTADLLERTEVGALIGARYDVVLVDEFQDLNRVQYRIVKALAAEHRHVFAVGDHEQSIYSWAGADPVVFRLFANDFDIVEPVSLEENRRCPNEVFGLARKLVAKNKPIFRETLVPRTNRSSPFAVQAVDFPDESDEAAWVVEDLRRDRFEYGHRWGNIAVLYRKHDIGAILETELIKAGIPCLLPRGRALADDPVIAFVIAACRVIARPKDQIIRDDFFKAVLPAPLYDEALARASEKGIELLAQLNHMAAHLPNADEAGRQVRLALANLRNLRATAKQCASLGVLLQELLSRRVGVVRSVLDDRHDEISDPASIPNVVRLAEKLREARANNREVWIPQLGGVEIPVKGMLRAIGIKAVRGPATPSDGAIILDVTLATAPGLPMAVFKAMQLIEMDVTETPFMSFTAVDLETTDNDADTAEIVEIAAVRVRDGQVTDTYRSFVKPTRAISAGALASHHISEEDVASAPSFAHVLPAFRAFCGQDVVVAHNGYDFDFKVLSRMSAALNERLRVTPFDTLPMARDLFQTSRKLSDLANHFGIPVGTSHRALDDSLTLAKVYLSLWEMKQVRARKTALINMLDHLGVALALCDERALDAEAKMFRGVSRVFSLGRYSNCLGFYEREARDDVNVPSVDEVIDRLGGVALMTRIRAEKSADERYPAAMQRLRRILADLPDGSLPEQLGIFLERVVLSRWDGHEPDPDRVNLLTLHSTKGLEFSRVYIVGAEDAQLPGITKNGPSEDEIEEARRVLYVGMTRTIDRLILTRCEKREDEITGGHRFLDEMGLAPQPLSRAGVTV